MRKGLIDRFFEYVKMDTQSKEGVEDKYPSTDKQKKLLNKLVDELKMVGCENVSIDKNGYVMGTFRSNLSEKKSKNIPTIGLIAHVDTSPEMSGSNVKPVLHKDYSGEDIELPGDDSVTIKVDENPDLKNHIGDSIITSDGTTLLGADDKAGITEIMGLLEELKNNPEIKHGDIRIAFTPDEEIGEGTKYFNIEKFNADYAYTVDGGKAGGIENETFNAAQAIFTLSGVNVHPGYAKDKLVNSIKMASDLVKKIDEFPAPENTEGREGYLHPYTIEGGTEETQVKVLIRDFEKENMKTKKENLQNIKKEVVKKFPKGKIKLDISDQYENMGNVLDENKKVVDIALEATKDAGIDPELNIIRGGTDGARLCSMGLPTPNIFTGAHNFHSKKEWIAAEDMEKTVKTLINLVQLWAKG